MSKLPNQHLALLRGGGLADARFIFTRDLRSSQPTSPHMLCLVSELSERDMSECPRETVHRRGDS